MTLLSMPLGDPGEGGLETAPCKGCGLRHGGRGAWPRVGTFVAVSACKAFRDGKLMRLPPRTLADRTSRSHGPPSQSHHHSSESVVPEMDLDLCPVDNHVLINI